MSKFKIGDKVRLPLYSEELRTKYLERNGLGWAGSSMKTQCGLVGTILAVDFCVVVAISNHLMPYTWEISDVRKVVSKRLLRR